MTPSPMIRRFAALAAGVVMTSAALTTSAAGTTTPVFTHKDSGRTVHLSRGTIFKVKLKTCFDCGDSWHWKHRPDHHIVKQLRKHRVAAHLLPGESGGIGRTVYTFKVVGVGTTRMVLIEKNPAGNVISHFRLTQSRHPLAY